MDPMANTGAQGPANGGSTGQTMPVVPAEDTPDVTDLVIRDDTPVESIYAERQYRLLTEPLGSSWAGPGEGRKFLPLSNVGLFYRVKVPPLVPDVMLCLDPPELDLSRKEHNSYFMWEFGKPPDVVIELVSDRRGGEDSTKFRLYCQIGVPYYVIFDPKGHLSNEVVRSFVKTGATYISMPDCWFPSVGLGLTLWEGEYQGWVSSHWLRWCDERGQLIPTGHELADSARQRAEQERQRAEQAHQRAEQERQRRERAEAKLREMGIDPDA
jgi:hypothetical protein